MSGLVFYKFKHQTSFDKVEFNSAEISVAELRLKIVEKLALVDPRHSAHAIQICRISPSFDVGAAYEDDQELIKTNTRVLVLRIPSKQGTQTKKIVVDTGDFFVDEFVEGDYLKLKESIIAQEVEARKACPRAAVCQLCRALMIPGEHAPALLICCGNTVCMQCAGKGNCPMEKNSPGNFRNVLNKTVARLVDVVVREKELFIFEDVVVPPGFLDIQNSAVTAKEAEETVIDLDEYEPEVFDVDNPRPLTDKEKEIIERRERRKRKALEILEKREGQSKKVVKGELTEGEINSLLKSEIKAELHGLEGLTPGETSLEDPNDATDGMGPIAVEFPRLLTAQEFEVWKRI
jgi:hypothetical protein